MTYDTWKTTDSDVEWLGERSRDENFYDYIARLQETAETPEQEAAIEIMIRSYENENGPRDDGWSHVEFPFAANH